MALDTGNLNVGDRVLVCERYIWNTYRHKPGTVTHKSRAGVTTVTYAPYANAAGEVTFNKRGIGRGNSSSITLEEFSQQVLDREAHRDLIREKRRLLDSSNLWRKELSDESILQIAGIAEADLSVRNAGESR